MNFFAKRVTAGVLAAALAASALPASAKDGKNGALLGGLAAGALLGGAVGTALGQQQQPQAQPEAEYEEPRPVVRRARPVYEQPVEDVSEDCHFERRKSYDIDGNVVGSRRVKVCE